MLALCTNRSRSDLRLGAMLLGALTLAGCALGPAEQKAAAASPSPSSPSAVTGAAGQSNAQPVSAATPVAAAVVSPQAQQQFDAALVLANGGKSSEAMQQFEKLAAVYPEYASPLVNLGLLQIKSNQMEGAIKSLQTALQRDAQSAPANNYLRVAYRQLGRFKEAEQAYQNALTIDDSYAPAHLNLGVLYDLYLQQPAAALAQYERYQQLLATPDSKVASWIKELKGRVNKGKAASPEPGAAK